jgi:hypothetical protein
MTKLLTPKKQPIPVPYWRLRWKFEFSNKPTKCGVWDLGSDHPNDAAWRINKEGLTRASIEGENRETYEIRTFFECEGSDYAFCQGEAFVKVPGVLGLKGSVTIKGTVAGISFLTREEKISVWVNGTVSRRLLSIEEKKFNFMEHKK